ncbi:MAG TPA: hypothetical protein VIW24_24820 [Aldersonia sp.]
MTSTDDRSASTLPRPDEATVRDAVSLACRAPSLHNSQPWRWVYDGDKLDLYADPTRLVQHDAHGRQLQLSCGAALDHLAVALAVHGWRAVVNRFPDPRTPSLLASLIFVPARFVTDAEHRRADAIAHRHTDRLPFAAPAGSAVWSTFLTTLTERVADYVPTSLAIVPEDRRADLAEASRLTAARRRYDAEYHNELRWWTGHPAHEEGVPADVLPSADERARVPIARTFPPFAKGEPTAAERRPEVAADESALLVLCCRRDEPLDWLRCGEALSAVLLDATMAGYATCPLTHLTEIPASRAVVARAAGTTELPQVVVRIGTAPAGEPERASTARRPLADVFTSVARPA